MEKLLQTIREFSMAAGVLLTYKRQQSLEKHIATCQKLSRQLHLRLQQKDELPRNKRDNQYLFEEKFETPEDKERTETPCGFGEENLILGCPYVLS